MDTMKHTVNLDQLSPLIINHDSHKDDRLLIASRATRPHHPYRCHHATWRKISAPYWTLTPA